LPLKFPICWDVEENKMKIMPSLAFLVTMMLVLLAALTRPVAATFAGRNGPIAFIQTVDSLNGAVGDIFTINPDGTNLKQLTSFGSSGIGAGLENWSPDGRHIAFQLYNQNTGQGQLWLMNADGSNQHVVLSDPNFNFAQPSFSPDGTQIVGARCGTVSNCALYRANVDGSGFTLLTANDINPDQSDLLPVYSPDGTTIAFTSTARGGVISAVYLMNADGSNIRRLTPPAFGAWIPDWSPDGQKLSFSTYLTFNGQVQDEEIWSINPDGSDPTRLTNNNSDYEGYFAGHHDTAPSWSPQGDEIAFERDAPDYSSSAIYIMNADGSGQKLVLNGVRRRTPKIPLRRGRSSSKPQHGRQQLVESLGTLPRWGAATN
jgi:TolB protein